MPSPSSRTGTSTSTMSLSMSSCAAGGGDGAGGGAGATSPLPSSSPRCSRRGCVDISLSSSTVNHLSGTGEVESSCRCRPTASLTASPDADAVASTCAGPAQSSCYTPCPASRRSCQLRRALSVSAAALSIRLSAPLALLRHFAEVFARVALHRRLGRSSRSSFRWSCSPTSSRRGRERSPLERRRSPPWRGLLLLLLLSSTRAFGAWNLQLPSPRTFRVCEAGGHPVDLLENVVFSASSSNSFSCSSTCPWLESLRAHTGSAAGGESRGSNRVGQKTRACMGRMGERRADYSQNQFSESRRRASRDSSSNKRGVAEYARRPLRCARRRSEICGAPRRGRVSELGGRGGEPVARGGEERGVRREQRERRGVQWATRGAAAGPGMRPRCGACAERREGVSARAPGESVGGGGFTPGARGRARRPTRGAGCVQKERRRQRLLARWGSGWGK